MQPWRIGLFVAGLVYLLLSTGFLFFGTPNADEGWYLYASHLVYHGLLPYRDFAYSQMPLLPYLYGLPQFLLHPGIYLGRVTSVFFSLLTFVFCLAAARRRGGVVAAGATAALLIAFTFGLYFNTIVKTYALISCLMALTLLVLSGDGPPRRKLPLAVLPACLTALVRLNAVVFSLSVIGYSLVAARDRRTRLWVIGVALVAAAVGAAFVLPHFHAALWNLLGLHVAQWALRGEASSLARLGDIFGHRLPTMLIFLGPFLLVGIAAAVGLGRQALRERVRRRPGLLAAALGLALFAVSYLANGVWYTEYLAPLLVVTTPLLGMLFAAAVKPPHSENHECHVASGGPRGGGLLASWRGTRHTRHDTHALGRSRITPNAFPAKRDRPYAQGRRWAPAVAWGALLVAVVWLLPGGRGDIDPGYGLPLTRIRQVANYVRQRTAPTDRLLVLEGLWVAVDANRPVLPGLTMAQFSYRDLPTAQARRLKVVNHDMIVNYLRSGAAKVVVLTEFDFLMLARRQAYSIAPANPLLRQQVLEALNAHYKLATIGKDFGQSREDVFVLIRR